MARSIPAEKTATTFTGYQMLTGMNVRTARAVAPRATTAMLVVHPTLTRRWLECDTDRNCIEHLEVRQMMELRHWRPSPEGSSRQCVQLWMVAGRSSRSHRRLTMLTCGLQALVDTIARTRPDRSARCPQLRILGQRAKAPVPIPHTTFILDQYVQCQRNVYIMIAHRFGEQAFGPTQRLPRCQLRRQERYESSSFGLSESEIGRHAVSGRSFVL